MIQIIRDKILNYTGTDGVPLVIVGNKSDLALQRQVTEADGRNLAKEWKSSWTEASARQDDNVAKVFDLILHEIEKTNEPNKAAEASKGCTIA